MQSMMLELTRCRVRTDDIEGATRKKQIAETEEEDGDARNKYSLLPPQWLVVFAQLRAHDLSGPVCLHPAGNPCASLATPRLTVRGVADLRFLGVPQIVGLIDFVTTETSAAAIAIVVRVLQLSCATHTNDLSRR